MKIFLFALALWGMAEPAFASSRQCLHQRDRSQRIRLDLVGGTVVSALYIRTVGGLTEDKILSPAELRLWGNQVEYRGEFYSCGPIG